MLYKTNRKMSRKGVQLLAFSTLCLLGLLSFSSFAYATDPVSSDSASASTDVTLNLADAISVRILDSTGTSDLSLMSFDFTPTASGTSSTARAIVEVGTSNVSGYELYMQSNYEDPTSTTAEHPVYTTSLVNTDTTIPTAYGTIPTTITDIGTTVKNYWYYYNPLIVSASAIGNSTIPAYNSPDKIAEASTAIDSDRTNVDITVGIDTTIAAGTYRNSLLFSAIANPIPTNYTLSFNLDGGSAPSSDPDAFDDMTVSEAAASHTFTIPSITPEKSGYSFTYWTDSSSNQYNPGDTITVLGNEEYVGTETLTANWSPATFWTINTMQEMTPDICNSVYKPAAYTTYTGPAPVIVNNATDYTATTDGTNQVPERTLIDYRGIDGTGTAANPVLTGSNVKTYTVRKLADGNCWMTEHLQLPLAVGTTVEASFGTTSASPISVFSYTPTSNASIGTHTRQNTSYGGWYYNWYAATAEQGTASTAAEVDVNGSICPKGWRLPANYSVDTTLSWGALTNAYGITVNGANTSTSTGYLTLEASPLSLQRSGRYSSGTFNSGGVAGYYWSSTAQSTSYAYDLVFSSSSVYPQEYHDKSANGFSIRCLAVR